MQIDLNFDEAAYLYKLLRECLEGSGGMPDDLILEDMTKTKEQVLKYICTDAWRDVEYYSRIVPKLLRAFPEVYLLRNIETTS